MSDTGFVANVATVHLIVANVVLHTVAVRLPLPEKYEMPHFAIGKMRKLTFERDLNEEPTGYMILAYRYYLTELTGLPRGDR